MKSVLDTNSLIDGLHFSLTDLSWSKVNCSLSNRIKNFWGNFSVDQKGRRFVRNWTIAIISLQNIWVNYRIFWNGLVSGYPRWDESRDTLGKRLTTADFRVHIKRMFRPGLWIAPNIANPYLFSELNDRWYMW